MVLDRRRFLLGSAAVAGGLALSGMPWAVAASRSTGTPPRTAASPPRVLRSRNGVLHTTLTAGDGPATAAGVRWPNSLMTYNGLFSGPTMIVRPGDRIEMLLRNRIAQPTNMHWHGFHASPKGNQDNVFLDIQPGEDYQYDVQIPDDMAPGLYWYHPHRHGYVGAQLYGGMRGLIVVEGGITERPEVSGLRTRLLNLNYLSLDTSGAQTQLVPYDSAGPNSAVHLMNSEVLPTLTMNPGETQFWRIANTATDAYYRIEIPRATIQVVEQDGGAAWTTWFTDSLVMPPGKRFGLLVTAPAREGTTVLRSAGFTQGPFGEWPEVDLATIRIAGEQRTGVTLPTQLADPPAYLSEPVARRRLLTMNEAPATDAPVFWFNNTPFEQITMSDVFQVRLDTVEEWVIRNATVTARGEIQESHPYHQHVNDFVIVERGTWDPMTGDVLTSEAVTPRSSMDTANVDPNTYIRIRTKYRRFVGRTVYHCHILFHEDNGMMGVFDIVDAEGRGVGRDQLLPTQTTHEH